MQPKALLSEFDVEEDEFRKSQACDELAKGGLILQAARWPQEPLSSIRRPTLAGLAGVALTPPPSSSWE
jgi:hypothetical protein